MFIAVGDLPTGGQRLVGTIELELEPGPDDLILVGPAAYDLHVERRGKRIEVSGSLEARVGARCGRCARRYELAVARRFVALYEARQPAAMAPSLELDEDDLALDYYDGDAIDGRTLLAEQILLALPMKLVCADDCRGLCPRCGANLNETDCNCEKEVDPRMVSLRALRDRL